MIYGLSQQARYEQAANDSSNKYARYAYEKAAQPCYIIPGGEQSRCLLDAKRAAENEGRDKQREYDDLVAQQKSALWTNIMGVAAITGMILSVVGVWLVYATFRETRRTADEARRSSDAFIAAERGWLELSADSIANKEDGGQTIKLRVRGRVSGKAGVKVISVHCRRLENDRFPSGGDWQIDKPRITNLEPEQPASWMVLGAFDMPNGEGFIGGWATYRTQFPGEKVSHFLFKMEVGSTFGDGSVRYSPRTIDRTGWPQDT